MKLVEVDRSLMLQAMDLSVEYGLRGADAVHLAAALRAECRRFYTFDDDFLRLNGKINDLMICEPVATGQVELDV